MSERYDRPASVRLPESMHLFLNAKYGSITKGVRHLVEMEMEKDAAKPKKKARNADLPGGVCGECGHDLFFGECPEHGKRTSGLKTTTIQEGRAAE